MQDFTQLLPGGIPLDMIFVKGNDTPDDRDFMMGSVDKEAGDAEKPIHPVRLRSFFIGKYPLTQAQWKAVMGAGNNPSRYKGDRRPVENVSWFDAAVFCNALSSLEGKEPCYYSDKNFQNLFGNEASGWKSPNKGEIFIKYGASGYRLPTEAEWEYTARGGPWWESEGYRYAGSDLLEQVGWYDKNSGNETRDVGLLLPNALGLCDMSGNVWEWCGDWYGGKYYEECLQEEPVENPVGPPTYGIACAESKPVPVKNPVGPPTGSFRVYRGGGYFHSARYCRVAFRSNYAPGLRNFNLGFRPLLSFQADG